ncbi:EAL domain-containing protein [Alteromonas ponticola]|uniref:EAL domain-containing protein n=1 Tax=Alteromonas aquimaris TaxID=2998417 RepID=A0ABT3P5A5_9ALTE|nr:EAL domain-containing protein [Alteromonas aquimaris]MCW8107950.1 EAL domain-containing protein [Alteromonas aquimaris]
MNRAQRWSRLTSLLSDVVLTLNVSGAVIVSMDERMESGSVLSGVMDNKPVAGNIKLSNDAAKLCARSNVTVALSGEMFAWPRSLQHLAVACSVHFQKLLTHRSDDRLYIIVLSPSPLSIQQQQTLMHLVNKFSEMNTSLDKANEGELTLQKKVAELTHTGGCQYFVESGDLIVTDEFTKLLNLPNDSYFSLRRGLQSLAFDDRRTVVQRIRKLFQTSLPAEHNFKVGEDINARWLRLTLTPQVENNVVSSVVGALQDITDAYQRSSTEQNYTEYLVNILDNLNDAVITIDGYGTIIMVNQTVEKVFGFPPETLLGQDVSIIVPEEFSDMPTPDITSYLSKAKSLFFGPNKELTARHKNGHQFPIELSLTEVILDGQRRYIGIIRDVTERKEAIDNIFKIAFYDDVTQLANFKSFEKDVRKLIVQARVAKAQLYCCMVDIDKFAQYNLLFGKETGDQILKITGNRIKKVLTADFRAYRKSADRFLILHLSPIVAPAKETNQKRLAQVNLIEEIEQKLLRDLAQDISFQGDTHTLRCSLSSVQIDSEQSSFEKVIGVLEFGRKRAKQSGHIGPVAFEKSAYEEYERHQYITQSFHRALADDEFFIVLQPQYNRDGELICSEVLVRWQHAAIGLISPGEFIPIAEESEAILDIGYWVLNEACKLLAECHKDSLYVKLAVNISAQQIARADFAERLIAITSKWEVDATNLVLELTETTLVESIDQVRLHIEKLSGMGFSFSIDDFGTGYSSLSYLKSLPIAELKIDRFFVDEITSVHQNFPIVNTIIEMAQALGLRTVAEGIENDVQMEYLIQHGCDIFQGFHLGRPVVEQKWLDLVKASFIHSD